MTRRALVGPLAGILLLAALLVAPASGQSAPPVTGASPAPGTTAATSTVPAASPSPAGTATPGASAVPDLVASVDARSAGEGPGLRGSPIEIALAVLVLGLITAAATAAWIRVSRRA